MEEPNVNPYLQYFRYLEECDVGMCGYDPVVGTPLQLSSLGEAELERIRKIMAEQMTGSFQALLICCSFLAVGVVVGLYTFNLPPAFSFFCLLYFGIGIPYLLNAEWERRQNGRLKAAQRIWEEEIGADPRFLSALRTAGYKREVKQILSLLQCLARDLLTPPAKSEDIQRVIANV